MRSTNDVLPAKETFVDTQDRAIPAAPPSGASGKELEELELFLREADLCIDPPNEPQWDGSRLELGDALDWLFR